MGFVFLMVCRFMAMLFCLYIHYQGRVKISILKQTNIDYLSYRAISNMVTGILHIDSCFWFICKFVPCTTDRHHAN